MNSEGAEILPLHLTPGPETKDFRSHSTAGSMSLAFKSVSLTPKSHGRDVRLGPGDTAHAEELQA